MSASTQRGMTLIEVLIAMATLAFMAVSVIVVFRNSTDVQEDIRATVSYTHLTLPTKA